MYVLVNSYYDMLSEIGVFATKEDADNAAKLYKHAVDIYHIPVGTIADVD